MAAPVDPSHCRSLLRGLPDALKILVQPFRERIQATIVHNLQAPQKPPSTFWLGWRRDTIVTHIRWMGWTDPQRGASVCKESGRLVTNPGRAMPLGSRDDLRQIGTDLWFPKKWSLAKSIPARRVPNAAIRSTHRSHLMALTRGVVRTPDRQATAPPATVHLTLLHLYGRTRRA